MRHEIETVYGIWLALFVMNSSPMWQQHKLKLERRIGSHVLRTVITNSRFLLRERSLVVPNLVYVPCSPKVTSSVT